MAVMSKLLSSSSNAVRVKRGKNLYSHTQISVPCEKIWLNISISQQIPSFITAIYDTSSKNK